MVNLCEQEKERDADIKEESSNTESLQQSGENAAMECCLDHNQATINLAGV